MEARQRARHQQPQAAPVDVEASKAGTASSRKKAKRTRRQRLLAATPYLAAAAAAAHFANLYQVLLDEEGRLLWSFLTVSALCAACVFLVFLYLSVFIPITTGRTIDLSRYEITAPRAIPLATALSCISFFAAVVGLWPVYGIWTSLLILVEFLGFVSFVTIF